MTTTTRKTLEMAALAAGYTIDTERQAARDAAIGPEYAPLWLDFTTLWNPGLFIEDAARLAVRLRMWIDWIGDSINVQLGGKALASSFYDGTHADAERAYCEAVTLCAAEIGRRMREGGG